MATDAVLDRSHDGGDESISTGRTLVGCGCGWCEMGRVDLCPSLLPPPTGGIVGRA